MRLKSALYSLRDFYAEEGKSLRMEYSHYWKGPCRYREKRICRNVLWGMHRKMHRINGWHKFDIFHKRIGKGYCASKIWDAELHLHPQIAYNFIADSKERLMMSNYYRAKF